MIQNNIILNQTLQTKKKPHSLVNLIQVWSDEGLCPFSKEGDTEIMKTL